MKPIYLVIVVNACIVFTLLHYVTRSPDQPVKQQVVKATNNYSIINHH